MVLILVLVWSCWVMMNWCLFLVISWFFRVVVVMLVVCLGWFIVCVLVVECGLDMEFNRRNIICNLFVVWFLWLLFCLWWVVLVLLVKVLCCWCVVCSGVWCCCLIIFRCCRLVSVLSRFCLVCWLRRVCGCVCIWCSCKVICNWLMIVSVSSVYWIGYVSRSWFMWLLVVLRSGSIRMVLMVSWWWVLVCRCWSWFLGGCFGVLVGCVLVGFGKVWWVLCRKFCVSWLVICGLSDGDVCV